MCNLAEWLNSKIRIAKFQGYQAEIRRLKSELQEHREKCINCAGVYYTPLESHLFGTLEVRVAGKGKDSP